MSLEALISRWRTNPEIQTCIEEWRLVPARTAQTKPFPPDLHPLIARSLESREIFSLYTHQVAVWERATRGEDVVIVTGTASGKTLAYNLPVLDSLVRNPQARALFLFPTKALAQDQLKDLVLLCEAIQRLANTDQPPASDPLSGLDLVAVVYDGDTPAQARPTIRSHARLLISNPDMLHTGILPHHTAWAAFFKGLQFVVVDEMHVYRGVFGSHVANVLRRLQRIARFYGASPQFLLTSATIANPTDLAGKLIEKPVTLVEQDGSARGEKHFLIYNPPVIEPALGLRRSVLQDGVRLVQELYDNHVQTIVFARARKTVELLLSYLRQNRGNSALMNAPQIRGYRSGYLPRQRREIEHGLQRGQVRVVVATNALELGIDIGEMGAALLVGYPGNIASTWQQAGRAGRGERPSLSVLLASPSPLDQYLARHPEYFFSRPPEQALINPDNLLILLGHLRCAAFELPFSQGEGFGRISVEELQPFLEFLELEGVLHASGSRYFWMADRYPAAELSLRSASADTVALHIFEGENWGVIGQVDFPSATWMVHPGAVYLHEAQTYQVDDLDLERKIARLKPLDLDYYTEPRHETTVSLVHQIAQADVPGGAKCFGEIKVTSQVTGFRKVRWLTHEHLGWEELAMPPSELVTTGYWLSLSEQTVDKVREQGLWTGARNDYGPQWELLRERARARDGHRCQVCGIPEQERAHDVHHKRPFRAFSTAEQANQLTNLITLCPTCHRRVETAVRIRSGLAGLAFVLWNLAPLFLMCDITDLGMHSDSQSALVDGNPAIVLYDQVPAGLGFSEYLFNVHTELVERARELVASCDCSEGCPSCVGPGSEELTGYGGKREALVILEALSPMDDQQHSILQIL